jgi:hypothetical protein
MSIHSNTYSLSKILAILFLGVGAILAAYSLISPSFTHSNLQTGAFLDRLPIPFSKVNLGKVDVPILVDHFLVFQNYQVTPYPFTPTENYLFGIFIALVSVTALANLSRFKKIPFLGAGVVWILLLTLSNFNGLNIGGLSSNLSLLILLGATLIPTIYFHVWGTQSPFWVRWLVLAGTVGGALIAFILISPIINPSLYISEQSLIIGIGISIAWIFWQGHGILSGLLILISKANAGLNTKTSIQFAAVTLLYLGLLFLLLLHVKGDITWPIGDFLPLYLILPLGVLGWYSTREKLAQSDNLASSSEVLQNLYLLGFASTLWTIWKLTFSHNQAGEELLKHLVIYSQLGFSLFFFIYVAINFFPLMHKGKTVHSVLYKPFVLSYYHLRIGGTIAFMVLTTYLEAIIASQVSALTNNIVGDYYYQTNQKLEASILYENSWDRYRYNPKAKNLTAQLLFELDQPSLAKEHLEESFDLAPQVDNILLLSERLQKENKPFEAVFYLENGLKFFPSNPYLSQNLALLYTLVKKDVEAQAIFADLSKNNPVAAANWLAISVKLGEKVEIPKADEDLIFLINRVATERKNGMLVDGQTLEILKKKLKKVSSPLLLQAGYRNLLAMQNLEDPSTDLKLLDSLAKREDLLEYTMQFQETGILRSLGAGRINDAIKNLNGLAFRNPGDAAYYLNLSGLVLAQQLDFEKAAKDFAYASEKGFQAELPIHEAIRNWQTERAFGRLTTNAENEAFKDEFVFRGRFNQSMPQALFLDWKTIASPDFKLEMAWRLLRHKSHGLTTPQLQEIGAFFKGKTDRIADLAEFLQAPDWTNANSLRSFIRFIGASEELTANPYLSPLIWSAALQAKDKLQAYELLLSATEFNKDPLLWAKKVQAAQDLGLDQYATEAREEMKTWMSEEEIEALLGEMY